MPYGLVSLVAEGTGYSVQHASRILGGFRPHWFVLVWAQGQQGLPFDPAAAGVPAGFRVAGLRAALRRAYRAGERGAPIDGPALWATWRDGWVPVHAARNTKPHPARRHRMGRGGETQGLALARPKDHQHAASAQGVRAATHTGG